MLHNQKRALVDKQEKNLQEMKDLYGKRTANFLRGPIMEERKEQFQRWERNNEEYKRQQDREIEESETQMFLNSFSFAKHYLARNEDLSLISLHKYLQGPRLGYDNVGMRHWLHYQLNFLEIVDLIITECSTAMKKIMPFLESRFQKSCAELIRAMLHELLLLFNCRVTEVEVSNSLPLPSEDSLLREAVDDQMRKNWHKLTREDKYKLIPKKTLEEVRELHRVLQKAHHIMLKKISIITETVSQQFKKKIETQLVDLKIAWMYSKFYGLIGNWEKSYVLLSRAYRESKGVTNVLLRQFRSMSNSLLCIGESGPHSNSIGETLMNRLMNSLTEYPSLPGENTCY